MSVINVTSEIAPLKEVLLHRPGKELLNLTPDNLERLLFDDIPFLKVAQKEHDEFAKKLKENGVTIYYLENLMVEVLNQSPSIKKQFIEQFITEANINSSKYQKLVFKYLNNFQNIKKLVLKTMEGIKIKEIDPNSDLKDDFITDPMPNLYFTRDNVSPIGNGICLNKMYSITRNRENIYTEYIFNYHPKFFEKVKKYYERNEKYHIEGGDLLNLNEHILVIGVSQRTEIKAIKKLARNLFENSQISTIIILDIPKYRAFMHLDTVITQVDYDKFVYHPQIINTLKIYEITKNKKINVKELSTSLEETLTKYMGYNITLIPCAGGDKIASAREQWSDGSNTLAIAPGIVIAYDRNEKTNKVLKENGIKVIEIKSAEISRGRGGPRCMSMPLVRDK